MTILERVKDYETRLLRGETLSQREERDFDGLKYSLQHAK